MVHYDGIENGVPSGDRGLVLMENMHSVEKVLDVDTSTKNQGPHPTDVNESQLSRRNRIPGDNS